MIRPPAWITLPIVIALIATAPAWVNPLHRFVGRAEGEIRDHVWIAWLVQHRVWADHALPLSFPNVGFPAGITLYPLDPLNQLAVTVLTPLIGLAPALLLLTTTLLALSGIAGGRLATALGLSPTRAALVGVLTMIGPPILGSFVDGQTEGMGSCWALFALATFVDRASWQGIPGVRRGLRLGLEGAALIASSPYQAHAWTLAGGLLLVALVVRRSFPPLALLALLIWLPVGVVCGASLHHAEGGRTGQITQRSRTGDWPPRTIVPAAALPPEQPHVGSTPTTVMPWPRELRLMPPTTGPRRWAGVTLPILVGLAALTAALRLRGPRKREGRAALALAAGAMLYASIAIGSAHDYGLNTALPFDWWYRLYPLARLAWKPQQYAVPAWQLASIAAGFAPTPLLLIGTLIAILEIQLTSPVQLPLPALQFDPQPWMSAVDGPVIEFPSRGRARGGVGRLPYDELLAQTVHEQPIADPFGRGRNPMFDGLMSALGKTAGWPVPPNSPALSTAISTVARAGFDVLVVHSGALTQSERYNVKSGLVPILGEPEDEGGVWLWDLERAM